MTRRRVLVVAVVLLAVVVGATVWFVRSYRQQSETAAFYSSRPPSYFASRVRTDEQATALVERAFDSKATDDANPLSDPYLRTPEFIRDRRELFVEPEREAALRRYRAGLADIERDIWLPGLAKDARFRLTESYMEHGTNSYGRALLISALLDLCPAYRRGLDSSAAAQRRYRVAVIDASPADEDRLAAGRDALVQLMYINLGPRYC